MVADMIRKRLESVRHEMLHYFFDQMVEPVIHEAVRYSGTPSTKVRCDMCHGPFPSHVHVCDECSTRVLKPAVLRRLVRVFGKSIYVAVVNAEQTLPGDRQSGAQGNAEVAEQAANAGRHEYTNRAPEIPHSVLS
jgi:hypothetical protein